MNSFNKTAGGNFSGYEAFHSGCHHQVNKTCGWPHTPEAAVIRLVYLNKQF